MISPSWFWRKINDSGSKSRVVPYHASRFGRSSSVGSNCCRYRVLIALFAPSAATIKSQSANSATSSHRRSNSSDTPDLPAMPMQRSKQIDSRHAMERIARQRHVLTLVHDRHGIEHDLVVSHRLIEFGSDVADERQRNIREDQSPAIGGAFRIALVDMDIVSRIRATHQVREEESGRAAADDSDLHS